MAGGWGIGGTETGVTSWPLAGSAGLVCSGYLLNRQQVENETVGNYSDTTSMTRSWKFVGDACFKQ